VIGSTTSASGDAKTARLDPGVGSRRGIAVTAEQDASETRLRPVAVLRDQPVLLYVQIRNQLVDAFMAGDFQPGQRIPSEPELARSFRVGRPTVRQAVGLLRQEGWVVTQRGLGTYFVGKAQEISLLGFDGLTQALRARGVVVQDRVLTSGVVDSPELDVLVVDSPGQWWIVRRVRNLLRNDRLEPLCVEMDCFPLEVCPDAQRIFERTNSATAVLQETYGFQIAMCDVATRAITVPEEWRDLLALHEGAAVLSMERINRAPDGLVLHVGSFMIRTDLVPLVERIPNPAVRR
jgi:DNA-binding GntR family transcriptional regulator